MAFWSRERASQPKKKHYILWQRKMTRVFCQGVRRSIRAPRSRKDTFTYHYSQLESKWNSFPLPLLPLSPWWPFAFLFADNVFLQTPTKNRLRKACSREIGSLTLMSHKKESTLTYQINVPVWLPNFKIKPWWMFCDYFWPVKIISIDCLDSWRSERSKIRIQVNQIEMIFTGQK